MEIEKIMESVALQKIRGISEIKRGLSIVEKFVKKSNFILYGGMAIDFALKSAGKPGIYSDDVIPDYDFFSSNNFLDSWNLARILYNEGFTGTSIIPGIFPLTRRVRIDKAHFAADISYHPEPYHSKTPVIKYNSFTFVHPDYQRIDLHRSLSFLYENAPRENFRGRMKKDIKRFALIDKNIPIGKNYVGGEKIDDKYFISIFCNNNDRINIKKSAKKEKAGGMNENGAEKSERRAKAIVVENAIPAELAGNNSLCACGELAYFIYTEIIESICAANKSIPLPAIPQLDAISKWEFLTENFMELVEKNKSYEFRYFEKLFDIFPESAVFNDIVLYNNQRQLVAASVVNEFISGLPTGFAVANIHYTMAQTLLKYFCTGNEYFLDIYKNCREIIIWAEAHLTDKLIMSTPFFVNGTYFGKTNFSFALILDKKMQACISANRKFLATPIVQFNHATSSPDVDYSKYIAYKIDGIETDHPVDKKFDCKPNEDQ